MPYATEAQRRLMQGIAHGWKQHMGCGRGCDHFQLAYHRPQDWDVPKPAEKTVAGGVRLSLVNGSH